MPMSDPVDISKTDPFEALKEAGEFLRNQPPAPIGPIVFMWNGKVYNMDNLTKNEAAELLPLFKPQ